MNFYIKNDASKRNITKDHLYCKFCVEYFSKLKVFSLYSYPPCWIRHFKFFIFDLRLVISEPKNPSYPKIKFDIKFYKKSIFFLKKSLFSHLNCYKQLLKDNWMKKTLETCKVSISVLEKLKINIS